MPVKQPNKTTQVVALDEAHRKEQQRLLQQQVTMLQQWLSSAKTTAAGAPEGSPAVKEHKRVERFLHTATAQLHVATQLAQEASKRRQDMGIPMMQLASVPTQLGVFGGLVLGDDWYVHMYCS